MSTNVYQAICAVAADLGLVGISKDRKNQQQGYQFRGIDDIYAAINPLLSKHKLCILPRVVKCERSERQAKSGGILFCTALTVEFDLVSVEDGSKHTLALIGEAMDSADKSSSKAMSAAYKYACMQTFCIPTEGDNDADSTTHEVLPHQPRPATAAAPPAPAPTPAAAPPPATKAKKAPLTMANSSMRARFLEVLGCQEDGPEKDLLKRFLVGLGWLLEDKAVEQLHYRFVPLDKKEMGDFQVVFGLFKLNSDTPGHKPISPYAPHGLDPSALDPHPVAPPVAAPAPAPPAPAAEPAWRSFVIPFGKKRVALGLLTPEELAYYVQNFVVQETREEKQADGGTMLVPLPAESVASQRALRAALDQAKQQPKG